MEYLFHCYTKYTNFFDIQIIIPSSTSKVTQETHLPPLRNIKYLFQQYARYLSNRPQVSMGYKLINHAGCLLCNTRRICEPRAAGEWFMNSSSVLSTSQVVYQPINHKKLVVYCFYLIIQKTRDFSVGLLAQ